MGSFRNNIAISFLVVSFIFLGGCSQSPEKKKKYTDLRVILRVGTSELTMADIEKRFYRSYSDGPQDAFEQKEKYINDVLDQFLQAEAAAEAGYAWEVDSAIVYDLMLRELHHQEVASKIRVTDKAVRKYFKEFGGETQAGHILVSDSSLAESLYSVLQNGGDFDELAREFSLDLTNKDRGGSLDYMHLDYYDTKFMKVACNLDVGDYSRPLQTIRGWHIITLYDRRKNTPEDLESRWRKYRSKTYNYIHRKVLQEYKDQIKDAYNYEIVRGTMDMMIRKADSSRSLPDAPPDLPISSYLSRELFTEDESKMYIAKHDDGGYAISDFLDYLDRANPSRTPDLRNKVVMKDFFERAVLTPLLARVAFDRELDTLITFRHSLRDYGHDYIVQRYRREIFKDRLSVSESEIEKYYNENSQEYMSSDNLQVYAIGVVEEGKASELLKRIESGARFESLAKKYSVDRKTAAKGGDFGYFTVDRYPELFRAAENMEAGELGGPVEMYGNWWIFKLIDHRKPELKSLDRVRAGIETKLKQEKEQAAIEALVQELKEKAKYFIDLDPLRQELGSVLGGNEANSN
jgi:parvulin-like peptidyl-prolyl isomerase